MDSLKLINIGSGSFEKNRATVCLKNASTLASCSFNNHGLILIILGKQHQHTFRNDVRIQHSSSLYFYLRYLLLNICDGNAAKQRVFLGRLLVALKTAELSLANVQSDALSPSQWHVTAFSIDQQLRR